MLKNIFKEPIQEAQELIKNKYDEQGLTNEILEAQVELNQIRHALDIHDKSEELFEEYVQ